MSAEVSSVVSPYARCDPARTGRPSCRDGHTILEGGVRATSGGDLRGPGVNGSRNVSPRSLSSLKTSDVGTAPKISCWMIGALRSSTSCRQNRRRPGRMSSTDATTPRTTVNTVSSSGNETSQRTPLRRGKDKHEEGNSGQVPWRFRRSGSAALGHLRIDSFARTGSRCGVDGVSTVGADRRRCWGRAATSSLAAGPGCGARLLD